MPSKHQVNSDKWWDEMALIWKERGEVRDRPLEYEAVAKEIDCGPVAEVGMGFGTSVKYLNPEIQYIGFDISDAMVTKSREGYPDNIFVKADIMKMSKSWEKAFAYSVVLQTLEHFSPEDFKVVMKNLKRITKKALIFSVPRGYPSNAERISDGHLNGWKDEEELEKDFLQYGCKIKFTECNPNHIAGVLYYESDNCC